MAVCACISKRKHDKRTLKSSDSAFKKYFWMVCARGFPDGCLLQRRRRQCLYSRTRYLFPVVLPDSDLRAPNAQERAKPSAYLTPHFCGFPEQNTPASLKKPWTSSVSGYSKIFLGHVRKKCERNPLILPEKRRLSLMTGVRPPWVWFQAVACSFVWYACQ